MTNWKHIAEQLAEGMQEIDREYEGYMSHMHFRVMAKQIAETPGKSWSVPSRPRSDKHPLEPKLLFERSAA